MLWVVLGRCLAVSVAACGLGNSGLQGWMRGLCVALYEQVKRIAKEKEKILFPFKLLQNIE